MNKPVLLISLLVALFLSCQKNSFITSGSATINFSADTIYFDTVFTATGSITQSVKIINTNSQKLLLTGVRLMRGVNSPFKINIDGAPGPSASNIEVDPNDSLYVFVSVYVNPSAASLPFVLQDSIQVAYNGNKQYIQLQAYGQNAHFLSGLTLSGNTTWANDLPYVILQGLTVDTGTVLTIQPGCKIYCHANAPFIVNGTLLVQGQQYDSTRVYFQSDRRDPPYNSYPAGWPGLYFSQSSKDNVFEFAVINNAYQSVVAVGLPTDANPKVTLDECIINNSYDAGILTEQTTLEARNCLISNCGANIELTYGGVYNFSYCTVAGYSNQYIAHANPVLTVDNYAPDGSGGIYSLSASFVNCIFWGDSSLPNEVSVGELSAPGGFSVNFNYCLWLENTVPSGIGSSHLIMANPLFDSLNNQTLYYDFHLQSSSPAIGYGTTVGAPPYDLDGNPRVVGGQTDLGCYQKQ